MKDLRAQLSPGWSPVNIGLTVLLFFVAWPLGLLMIAYVVWGKGLGLDFARPETLSAFWGRFRRAWQAAKASFGSTSADTSATLAGGTPRVDGTSANGFTPASDQGAEREALQREKAASDAEKRDGARRRSDEQDTIDS